MKYFTENLDVIETEVKQLQEECKNNPDNVDELAKDFTLELLEINKLLTIEKYLKIRSDFYKGKFYKKITETEENTIIPKYGIGMTEETFEIYLNKYNEEYELK